LQQKGNTTFSLYRELHVTVNNIRTNTESCTATLLSQNYVARNSEM